MRILSSSFLHFSQYNLSHMAKDRYSSEHIVAIFLISLLKPLKKYSLFSLCFERKKIHLNMLVIHMHRTLRVWMPINKLSRFSIKYQNPIKTKYKQKKEWKIWDETCFCSFSSHTDFILFGVLRVQEVFIMFHPMWFLSSTYLLIPSSPCHPRMFCSPEKSTDGSLPLRKTLPFTAFWWPRAQWEALIWTTELAFFILFN